MTADKPRKPHKHRVRLDWVLVATLATRGLTSAQIAEKVGAASDKVIVTGLKRRGHNLTAIRAQAAEHRKSLTQTDNVTALVVAGPKAASDDSKRIRATLQGRILAAVQVLPMDPCSAELAGRDGLAQTLKTIADAASTACGWDAEDRPGSVAAVELKTAWESMRQVATPSCVSDTPTGGVLEGQGLSSIPQLTEPVDVEQVESGA